MLSECTQFTSDTSILSYPLYRDTLGLRRKDLMYPGERYFSVTGRKCMGLLKPSERSTRCDGRSFRDHVTVLRTKCCSRIGRTILATMKETLSPDRNPTTIGTAPFHILSTKYKRNFCTHTVQRGLYISIITFSLSGSTVLVTTHRSSEGTIG